MAVPLDQLSTPYMYTTLNPDTLKTLFVETETVLFFNKTTTDINMLQEENKSQPIPSTLIHWNK